MSLYQDKFGHMRACIWTYRHMYGHHHWTYMHLEIFGRLGHTRIYPDTVVATHGQGRRRDGACKCKERAGTERGQTWHGTGSTLAARRRNKGARLEPHTVQGRRRDGAHTRKERAARHVRPSTYKHGLIQEHTWMHEWLLA